MYSELKEFLEDIEVRDGESVRTSCPVCGGNNTFTVTRDETGLLYNCYKNSCNTRGVFPKGRSVSSIRDRVHRRSGGSIKPVALDLDKTNLTVPLYNKSCNAYLNEVNATEAIADGYAPVMYDIAEHRCVFMIYNEDYELIGATGRALAKGTTPKWKRYDRQRDILYICGPREGTAVLVEDCASAVTVYASGYTGVALLGTNLSDAQIQQLRVFDKVIVALDADASRKGIKMQRLLAPYVDSEVRLLTEDLKYFSPEVVGSIIAS